MYTLVAVSTVVIFVLSFLLSVLITISYTRNRSNGLLFWSMGMWIFAACVLLEMIFAIEIYSQILIKLYLLLVAVLVEVLAMGSMTLLRRRAFCLTYGVYSIAVTGFLVYALATAGSIGNLLTNGVVYGGLPISITIGSVLITAFGAIILILISIVSYMKKRDPKLLSIILGVLVLSAGGTLYIASFPSFLYITEFVGIVFMWIGFVDFRSIFQSKITSNRSLTH